MDSHEFFGRNAGIIWEVLREGPKTSTQLEKATGLTKREVGIGLGWLAREGKLEVIEPERFMSKFRLIE